MRHDEFLKTVSDKGGPADRDRALPQVKAVFSTLAGAVSEGEVKDLRSQLPTGFAPLFS